ncbi:ArsR family transcriptional regulator [Halorubrum tibetense]|uniref:ArsR family transcriptional regulator n=1 Tax=Halorubrum tibetense TaxID=175631 RepID=A0ABD5S8H1_9EURY
MDSAVLLDLLGNENRRRILRLLAQKPCYVTEISEYIGVSPKAVIDHLRKLEEAGLIESTTDDQRRKYFRITRSLRLEVSVSPYGFGAKSAYPARSTLDMSGRCPHLTIEIDGIDNGSDTGADAAGSDAESADAAGSDAESADTAGADVLDPTTDRDAGDGRNGSGVEGTEASSEIAEIAAEYGRLQEIDRELSLAQRWIHGRVEDALAEIDERLGTEADSRFYAAVLAALTETDGTVESVAEEVGAREEAVTDALRRLSDVGVVTRTGETYRIR